MTTIVAPLTQRSRIRAGRRVRYIPTATEAAAYGAGPFEATIANPRASGNADLTVNFPAPLAGYGTIDNTYGAPEAAALTDAAPTRHLVNVPRGTSAGTYSLFGV